MITIVQYNQSLMDLAVQKYGNASGVVALANDNGLAIDADVFAGDKLIIRDELPEVATVVFAEYIGNAGIVVVSGQGGESELIEVLSPDDDEIFTDNDDNGLVV